MAEWLPYLLLLAAGFVTGVLNVVAAGGSFLTLPILIFLGLPATVANGTNRVGVLLHSVSAVWGFHRHQMLDWPWGLRVSLPAVIGAAIGTWGALEIGEETFKRILALVMLGMTAWTLVAPSRHPLDERLHAHSWLIVLGFFVVGLYGGFIQAGVGFLILAVTSMAGFDLVRGNGIKALSVFLLTALSLAIFWAGDSVHWPMGIALGVGNFFGALLGVRLTVVKGHGWVKAVVTVTIVLFAIRLWFDA